MRRRNLPCPCMAGGNQSRAASHQAPTQAPDRHGEPVCRRKRQAVSPALRWRQTLTRRRGVGRWLSPPLPLVLSLQRESTPPRLCGRMASAPAAPAAHPNKAPQAASPLLLRRPRRTTAQSLTAASLLPLRRCPPHPRTPQATFLPRSRGVAWRGCYPPPPPPPPHTHKKRRPLPIQ